MLVQAGLDNVSPDPTRNPTVKMKERKVPLSVTGLEHHESKNLPMKLVVRVVPCINLAGAIVVLHIGELVMIQRSPGTLTGDILDALTCGDGWE